MSLIDSEILADVLLLSPGLLIAGMVVGGALWLFGWRWHRFWIVLAATIAAGIFGLVNAGRFQSPPLVAAPLLALAAGVLALALVRLLAFFTGGMGGLVLVQSMAPQWEQPLVAFVLSGLVGLFLFRWCWMGLTSWTGTLLLAHCGLGLGQHYRALDVPTWIEQTGPMLNWILGGVAFLGLAFQFLLDRRVRRRRRRDDDIEELETLQTRSWNPFRRAG